VEEEVKIVISEVGTKPLIVVQVEIIETTKSLKGCTMFSFHFLSFHKDFKDRI
jgi:hypothetical protein